MVENIYTKEEVGRILGFNVKQFENFINVTLSIPINKETYSCTELLLITQLKKFQSQIIFFSHMVMMIIFTRKQ